MPRPPKPSKRPPRRGIRVPQQARSRRTRERILQVALQCFEERGYDATTTALIARRARVAVGTLYGYFRDKRVLLLELVRTTLRDISDYVVQGLDSDVWREGDPHRNVRRLIDAVFHARSFQPGMQRIVWERYFKDAEFRAAFEELERRIRDALEALLVTLKADGRVRVDDVATAASVVHHSLEWTATRLVLGDAGEQEIDLAVAVASDMVSRFLFPDP